MIITEQEQISRIWQLWAGIEYVTALSLIADSSQNDIFLCDIWH